MDNKEPLILSLDIGLTTGMAVGRRVRMHRNNKFRLDLFWDSSVRAADLYGTLEQVEAEFDLSIVIVELPVLNIVNPYYKELKSLLEEIGNMKHLFGNLPVVEIKPSQWKTTPAASYKPADNQLRSTHAWDAVRILQWFVLFGINETQILDKISEMGYNRVIE